MTLFLYLLLWKPCDPLFLRRKNTSRTTAGSLGVLTPHSCAPEVSQPSVESHLLHSLEILTEDTVQQVRVLVRRLSILDILGSVQEPQRNLELLRV